MKRFLQGICGTYVALEGQDVYNPRASPYLWLSPIFTEHSGTLDIEFPNTCLICSNSHLQLSYPPPSINSRTLGKISLTIDPLHSHTNAAYHIVIEMHTQLAEHKEWDEEKKRDRDGPTSTPGNGLPTYPGLRSPLSGLEIAIPNCRATTSASELSPQNRTLSTSKAQNHVLLEKLERLALRGFVSLGL